MQYIFIRKQVEILSLFWAKIIKLSGQGEIWLLPLDKEEMTNMIIEVHI